MEAEVQRSPSIAAKLEAARAARLALHPQLAQARLDVDDNVKGAEKVLADVREKIKLVDCDIVELEGACELASKRDRIAQATDANSMRATQLVEFDRAAAKRVSALTVMLGELLPKFATVFDEYVKATQRMVVAVPTGTRLPTMGWGDGEESWLGACGLLIGREAHRISFLKGTAKLPFARPPKISDADERKILPAIEMVEQAHAAVLREIIGQVNQLDRAALSRAGAELPPLPEKQPAVEAKPVAKPEAPDPASKIAPIEKKPAPPAFDAFAMSDADALAGLTRQDCAQRCSEAGCAISGSACAHPCKGGIRKADKQPKSLARFIAACDLVGVPAIHH
jgi:hypothetical protein